MNKKLITAAAALIVISAIAGIYLYPSLPEQMASHWNAAGEVDGYMSKFWGVFLMPILAAGMLLLFLGLPLIDPLRKNIEKFRKYYDGFIALMILFLMYIQSVSLAWNLGYRFNMGQMIVPAVGILIFYAGILITNAKRNWFIGIRTPWTLSSDNVWKKTHALGGKIFKVLGLLLLTTAFIPDLAVWIMTPAIIAALYPVLYSYLEYRKEEKKSEVEPKRKRQKKRK